MTENGLGDLAASLAKAQASFPKVVKDRVAKIQSTRGAYEYRYADLASIFDAIRKPLADNGLAITQAMEEYDGRLVLITTLLHTSGAKLDSRCALSRHDRPQDLGSELTYIRRYQLSALVGIASEDDDDGAAAQHASEDRPRQPRRGPWRGPNVTQEAVQHAGTDRPAEDPESPAIRAEADLALGGENPPPKAPKPDSEAMQRGAILKRVGKLCETLGMDQPARRAMLQHYCGTDATQQTATLATLRVMEADVDTAYRHKDVELIKAEWVKALQGQAPKPPSPVETA